MATDLYVMSKRPGGSWGIRNRRINIPSGKDLMMAMRELKKVMESWMRHESHTQFHLLELTDNHARNPFKEIKAWEKLHRPRRRSIKRSGRLSVVSGSQKGTHKRTSPKG